MQKFVNVRTTAESVKPLEIDGCTVFREPPASA